MIDLVPYAPKYALPPGSTLLEVLRKVGISQSQLARRIDRPLKTINDVVHGRATITAEMAVQFERVLPCRAGYWLRLEAEYRADLARLQELPRLERLSEWVSQFPLRELRQHRYLSGTTDRRQLAAELLTFFGVANREAWETEWNRRLAAYRQSTKFAISEYSTSAWVRSGELRAQRTECPPFDRTAVTDLMERARRLTRKPRALGLGELKRECLQAGIVLLILPEFPKTRVFGATRWVTSEKVMVLLSPRYRREDHAWFTFFHEFAHIVLHTRRDVFIDSQDVGGSDREAEAEANRFAMDRLIPPEALHAFVSSGAFDEISVRRFAVSLGIGAAIVVGRLQHEGYLKHWEMNDLRQPIDLGELVD